jgi:hypothetical protein
MKEGDEFLGIVVMAFSLAIVYRAAPGAATILGLVLFIALAVAAHRINRP